MEFAKLEKIEKTVAPRKGLPVRLRDRSEMNAMPIGEKRLGGGDCVAHRAMAHGAKAARIVAEHAAYGGLRRGDDLDG